MPKEPCWKCEKAPGENVFCAHCAALQPLPQDSDFFALLNQPYLFHLDLSALQDSFYTLSRQCHPDVYQKKGGRALAISTDNTALINAAYQTLSNPNARIPYLVALVDGLRPISTKPPEDIFDAVLELRETLDMVKEADAKERNRHLQTLFRQREQMIKWYRQEQADLEDQSGAWDRLEAKQGPPFTPAHRACAEKISRVLSHRAYMERVLNDTAPFFLETANPS